ncbi:hypothetical protein QJU89_04480 [Pasteurella skyensis]|uniref:Lipoprotein n=1 Tax=Phocoenobacter skyensis TaxID=97481 RepID=A0AAJ6P0C5_9PAST|nr:hypothetical protein [Pasteurella skyensis]MDP8162539.1 hypothetical protein [Pasteurella skyensis]MDP8172504.1 hypothetical protein [Pasteurella skyensis]MDP8177529.1 hypothetical protein [Pasteurella skyensis]MDP8178759.1 hypothetical protein [Pasteurella skyensis]MDP8182951.1 hypothetical protein [Pasteurella skyensis]
MKKNLFLIFTMALGIQACAYQNTDSNTPINFDVNSSGKSLILVAENHLMLPFKGNTYMMDTYIVPFENPYYIRVLKKGKASITKKEAVEVSKYYIKPRGCTQPIKRMPDLDKYNTDKTKWLIGISC